MKIKEKLSQLVNFLADALHQLCAFRMPVCTWRDVCHRCPVRVLRREELRERGVQLTVVNVVMSRAGRAGEDPDETGYLPDRRARDDTPPVSTVWLWVTGIIVLVVLVLLWHMPVTGR